MSLEQKWPLVRDILSFGVGVYGVVSEMQNTPKDPITLAFFAGLMGVPAMLSKKSGTK